MAKREKDPMQMERPMTRQEIGNHATLVSRHYLAGDTGTKNPRSYDSVEHMRLGSMIELAMCRAAGVNWGPVVIKKRRVSK